MGCHLLGGAAPVPDKKHTLSQIEGAVKRLAARMPDPDRAKIRRLKRFVERWLNKNMSDLRFGQDEDFEWEDYIDNTNYSLKRRENLTATHAENFNPVKGYNIKGFTKDEAYYPEIKHFRGIHTRADDYKTRIGPFFQKFGRKIFSTKYFIKKIPVSERAKFLEDRFRDKPNLFCTDFSSFEATFGPLLMRIELYVYSWFLKYNKHHDRIMHLLRSGLCGQNRIVFKNFMYVIWARRQSGEMNTSEGNGIMNLLMTFFLLEEEGNKEYDGIFEGDDSIITVATARPSARAYSELGANIKIDVPDNLSTASFCGLIFDEEILDNVCDPLDTLMSFGWTTEQYTNASKTKLRSLLLAKSLSLLYQYPGCPILRSLGLYGLRMSNGIDKDYMLRIIEKMKMCGWDRNMYAEGFKFYRHEAILAKTVNLRTRLVTEQKFGIPVEIQIQCEKYLDSKNDLSPLDMPWMDPFIHRDCRLYYDNYVVTVDDYNFVYTNLAKRKYKIWHTNRILELVDG